MPDIDGLLCTVRAPSGAVVAQAAVADAHQADFARALQAAGYQCECEEPVDLKAECTEDDHEVCDTSVALAYAREIAADTGTAAPELDALDAAGRGTRTEVREAVEALRDRLPEGDARHEADLLVADLERGRIEGAA